MTNLKEFHINHDYVVKVNGIKNRAGCIANYPENKFLGKPKTDKTYLLYTDPCSIELYITNYEETTSKNIPAFCSNIRLLVIQDIFLYAHSLGLSKELIFTDGSIPLFNMLEIPQTKEQKDVETQLCVRFRELLAGNVVASDIEGYEQVLSCFEKGGL